MWTNVYIVIYKLYKNINLLFYFYFVTIVIDILYIYTQLLSLCIFLFNSYNAYPYYYEMICDIFMSSKRFL